MSLRCRVATIHRERPTLPAQLNNCSNMSFVLAARMGMHSANHSQLIAGHPARSVSTGRRARSHEAQGGARRRATMEAWVPTAPNPAAIAQSHQTQRIRVQERRLQVCTSGRKRPYYIRRATTDLSPGARLISRSRGHAHLVPGDGSPPIRMGRGQETPCAAPYPLCSRKDPPFLVPQPLNAVERAYKRGGQVQRGSERVLIMKRGREGSSVTVQAANRPVEPALGRMGRIQPLNDALVHHERVANVHGDTGPLRDVEPSPAVDATPVITHDHRFRSHYLKCAMIPPGGARLPACPLALSPRHHGLGQ